MLNSNIYADIKSRDRDDPNGQILSKLFNFFLIIATLQHDLGVGYDILQEYVSTDGEKKLSIFPTQIESCLELEYCCISFAS